jgi:hypothetical protein
LGKKECLKAEQRILPASNSGIKKNLRMGGDGYAIAEK